MRRFIMYLGLVSLLLDLYVFQGVKRLTAGWQSARARKAVHWGYWIFFTAFTLSFMLAVYLRFNAGKDTVLIKWVMNLFLAFFVTKIIFILFMLAEDIVRIFTGIFRSVFKTRDQEPEKEKWLPGRRKFISQAALLLAGINFGAFLYGMVKGKYAYKIHRIPLYFEDLPEAFHGFTITQLSDFHAGSFDDPEAVREGLAMAGAQKSDLFVFTGDMVNNLASELEPFIKEIGRLQAPFGKFSIMGNHDYGMYHQWPSKEDEAANIATLKKHQAAMGLQLLLNESISLKKDGQEITLVGVENWGQGFIQKGDLDLALQNVKPEAFKVLLSHDPSHWQEKVKGHPNRVHLTLSGHTHGMQFGVETPIGSWSPARFRYETWAGLASENGRNLYVNRGFGFIGFSGRVGIWPEITVLELRKGKG